MSNFTPAENQKPSTCHPFDQPPPKLSKWGVQMKYNTENANPPLNETENAITTQPGTAENIRKPPGSVDNKNKNLKWYEICAPYYSARNDFCTWSLCNVFCRPLSLIGQCLHNVVVSLCCPPECDSRERNYSRGKNVTRNARAPIIKNVRYNNAYRSPRGPNYNTRHHADDNYYVEHHYYHHNDDDYVTNNVDFWWNVEDVANREDACGSYETGRGATEVSNNTCGVDANYTSGGHTGHSYDTGGGHTGHSCDTGGGHMGHSYDTGGGDTGGSYDTGCSTYDAGDSGGCDSGGGGCDSGGGGCDSGGGGCDD